MDHTNIKQTDEMVVMTVKADMMVGMIMSMDAPSSKQRQENSNPLPGTRCEESRPKALGATPTSDRPYSMRLVE